MRRKHSATESYESYLRVHIAPYFESRPIAKVTKEDVEGFVAACINDGQSVKSTLNYLGLLHGIFDFAIRRGWAGANPVKLGINFLLGHAPSAPAARSPRRLTPCGDGP